MTSPAHAPFFFAQVNQEAETLTLSKEDSRHLVVVRRAKAGDRIQVSDGRGTTFTAEIQSADPEGVVGLVTVSQFTDRPSPRIAIFQALAKGGKVDWVVQKLVELGVDQITIFNSERTEKRWDERRASRALDRWERIAVEAAKQSQRAWLPKVEGPVDFASVVSELHGRGVVGDLNAARSLRQALESGEGSSPAYAVVGPEGGLTDEELASLESSGALRVRLEGSVLRTETAGVVLGALLMYQLGRLG